MYGGRGLAVQLLVKDGLEQRFEGRGRRIEPQRERAGPVDQRAQLGVVGPQMRHRLGGIKGKFAAPAVVDHRGTVYRAARVSAHFNCILALHRITPNQTMYARVDLGDEVSWDNTHR